MPHLIPGGQGGRIQRLQGINPAGGIFPASACRYPSPFRCSNAGYNAVRLEAERPKLADDLLAGGQIMGLGVVLIGKLARQENAALLCQLLGPLYRP